MNTPSEFDALVQAELKRAREKHPSNITSVHEGLAIILEEFEELKREVFRQDKNEHTLMLELVETAAMCRRMYEDIFQDNNKPRNYGDLRPILKAYNDPYMRAKG